MYHLKHSFELKIQLLTSVTTSVVSVCRHRISMLVDYHVRPDRKPRMRRLRYGRTPCVGLSVKKKEGDVSQQWWSK